MKRAALLPMLVFALACEPVSTPDVDAGAPEPGVDAGPRPAASSCDLLPAVEDGANICVGDFEITSAAELTALAGCTRVTGDLTLAAPDVTNLDVLSSLVTIGGDLHIGFAGPILRAELEPQAIHRFGPTELTDFFGLSSLRRVEGALRFGSSPSFPQGGPPALASVVVGTTLSSLTGLELLEEVGALELATRAGGLNPALLEGVTIGFPSDLSALDGLRVNGLHVGPFIGEQGPTVLPSLTICGGDVTVAGAPLGSLAASTYPRDLGSLHLSNTALASLDGLGAVERIESLTLENNPLLFDGRALVLETVGDVSLSMSFLTAGQGMRVGRSTGTVEFTAGSSLWLAGLTEVAGDLEVGTRGRGVIRDGLAGLSNLLRVGGTLVVGSIGANDLSGLDRLTDIGGLTLGGSSLTSTGGLTARLAEGGTLGIGGAALLDVSGLASVTPARLEALVIGPTSALVDLSGLGGITTVEDVLLIDSNQSLETLDGLDGLTTVTGIGQISENFSLADCLAQAFADRVGAVNQGGHRTDCTCVGAEVVSCLNDCIPDRDVVTQADVDALAGVGCADVLSMSGLEVTELNLPDLRVVTAIRLQQALNLERVNLDSLESAATLSISDAPSLTSISLASLGAVDGKTVDQGITIDCTSVPGAPETGIPLESLHMPSLEGGFATVSGCSALPRCEVDHDLAVLPPKNVSVTGLDALCQCDANGDAIDGTCAP